MNNNFVEEPESNYSLGYIKLFRSIANKAWYTKSNYVHLWVHLLLKANHKGKEVMIGSNIIKLNPGQFVTGRNRLSEETGINSSCVERILKVFEKDGQIEQRTNNQNRILSIVSWDSYQQVEQRMNNKRTTGEQRANTNNNDNNDNNEKNIVRKQQFEKFFKLYSKSRDKQKCLNKFLQLKDSDIEQIFVHLPKYIQSTPEVQYRKDPIRYLTNRCWEDEVIMDKKSPITNNGYLNQDAEELNELFKRKKN